MKHEAFERPLPKAQQQRRAKLNKPFNNIILASNYVSIPNEL
jgi:hypothetical protein